MSTLVDNQSTVKYQKFPLDHGATSRRLMPPQTPSVQSKNLSPYGPTEMVGTTRLIKRPRAGRLFC